jgi:regulator of protease activity HflC (stomatin/prohibitin superfamily)
MYTSMIVTLVFFTITILLTAVRVLVKRSVIKEYETGLLYRNGRFRRRLGPGAYLLLRHRHLLRIIDLRKSFLTIPGQEVLSADNVAIKVSLAVAYNINDPVAATHTVLDARESLYAQAQLALRDFVAESEVEKLLQRRNEAGKRLLERVAPEAAKIGLEVSLLEIKDLMFPGELKTLFTASVRARNEGQAAMERARAETAAMRNLANAAGLMENHPTLLTLRWIQALDGRAERTGHTVIVGTPASVIPIREIKP